MDDQIYPHEVVGDMQTSARAKNTMTEICRLKDRQLLLEITWFDMRCLHFRLDFHYQNCMARFQEFSLGIKLDRAQPLY